MSMLGKSLVHYEISAQIGKGGMGEVYQAKDTKLGRDVAIKVLPEEFALDTDRVARFQREAKLLASLNHPNIAAIHGLEESEGIHFLVMELIEGDTLRDRIKSGPIPVEEALKLALQMAEALEAAHESGVIHRDLKPANIKVTPDGKVKVLDFGLAKAYAGDSDKMDPTDSPTLSAAATRQGVILGTAAYMSPEQARGEAVDKKADIWAFGVVLFEMLTGRQVFTGRTVSDTLASVLAREPEWNGLPPNLHNRIRLLLDRCLEKNPKDRYGSISDARVDIQRALDDPSGLFVQSIQPSKLRKKLRLGLPWVAAITIFGIIVAGMVVWYLRPHERGQVIRFDFDLPEDQGFTNEARAVVAVSRDGMKVVYVANQQLYLRNLNELTARPIPGSDENPAIPFFSPDGRWIGYWSTVDGQGQLKKIRVTGGAPVTLCNTGSPFGACWDDNDIILFGQEDGIMSVSANGGPAGLLIESKRQVHGPQILPGGKWVLFTIASSALVTRWDDSQIVAQSLESGERKILVSGGSDARYVPTGHLVYARGDVLHAIAFDAENLEVTGGSTPLIEELRRVPRPAMNSGTANYGFSDGGMLVYAVGGARDIQERGFVWVDREGNEEPLAPQPNYYLDPKLSPDGTKVALTIVTGGNEDIWVWDLVRENMTRLTFHGAYDNNPIWTPDGKRIVFASNREEAFGVYWKAADGTGEVEQLGSVSGAQILPSSWSKDGKDLIVEVVTDESGSVDIISMSMEGDHVSKQLLQGEYIKANPQISPDGRWIAFFSQESGQSEVYVHPFPSVNSGKWQISTNEGQEPRWSPDGRELYYRAGNDFGKIMMVEVETEPTFRASSPKKLFQGAYFFLAPGHSWDVHPDGKRFLMMKSPDLVGETPAALDLQQINIVLNWFEELKQKAPVD